MIEARLSIDNTAWLAANANYRTGVADMAEATRRAALRDVVVVTSDGVVVVVRSIAGNVG